MYNGSLVRIRVCPSCCPRYADPWCIQRLNGHFEPGCGLQGEKLSNSTIRRGGTVRHLPGFIEPLVDTPGQVLDVSMMPRLLRRISVEISRYRSSGAFSNDELRLIELIWLDRLSLREVSRVFARTPTRISQRIDGLAERAPRFYHWYLRKNYARRVACQAAVRWRKAR